MSGVNQCIKGLMAETVQSMLQAELCTAPIIKARIRKFKLSSFPGLIFSGRCIDPVFPVVIDRAGTIYG
jgi:hypothetical protein